MIHRPKVPASFTPLIPYKKVEKIADLCYYNIDLGESSLDHRRREEFPVIFFGVYYDEGT